MNVNDGEVKRRLADSCFGKKFSSDFNSRKNVKCGNKKKFVKFVAEN